MEENEKKVVVVDIDMPTQYITEIFTQFLENFFKEKDFIGSSSIEITKHKFGNDDCKIELKLCRTQHSYL